MQSGIDCSVGVLLNDELFIAEQYNHCVSCAEIDWLSDAIAVILSTIVGSSVG